MLICKPLDVLSSEITPRREFERRRELVRRAVALGLLAGVWPPEPASAQGRRSDKLAGRLSAFSTSERVTSYKDVTTYNNFYELGTQKHEPALRAHQLKTSPWSIAIEGEAQNRRSINLEDLLKLAPMEERIYRMRCVEGWSMVIPWVGYPLARLLQEAEPTSAAKYVAFVSARYEDAMPGLRLPTLEWPYIEALRIDEAMHPLTILSFGLYGEVLPGQNGAPVRIVVPWKYGFKSAKSIVKIVFSEAPPRTSWNLAAPREYGFYSNVNPSVNHPRWSQATERRIGEDGLMSPKRKTLLFNGYGDQVAHLYTGLDLSTNI